MLGLLGSSFPSEVLAAAHQAERLRRDAGLTWCDILGISVQPDHRDRDLAAFLRQLLESPGLLTDWERSFCRSLIARRRDLTAKQQRVLDRIVEKCRRARAAAA